MGQRDELTLSKSSPLLLRSTCERTSICVAQGRLCCKSRFALNSAGCRRGFRVKMCGTSSPHVGKNSSSCNFRLLQHNRPSTEIAVCGASRFHLQEGANHYSAGVKA